MKQRQRKDGTKDAIGLNATQAMKVIRLLQDQKRSSSSGMKDASQDVNMSDIDVSRGSSNVL